MFESLLERIALTLERASQLVPVAKSIGLNHFLDTASHDPVVWTVGADGKAGGHHPGSGWLRALTARLDLALQECPRILQFQPGRIGIGAKLDEFRVKLFRLLSVA